MFICHEQMFAFEIRIDLVGDPSRAPDCLNARQVECLRWRTSLSVITSINGHQELGKHKTGQKQCKRVITAKNLLAKVYSGNKLNRNEVNIIMHYWPSLWFCFHLQRKYRKGWPRTFKVRHSFPAVSSGLVSRISATRVVPQAKGSWSSLKR